MPPATGTRWEYSCDLHLCIQGLFTRIIKEAPIPVFLALTTNFLPPPLSSSQWLISRSVRKLPRSSLVGPRPPPSFLPALCSSSSPLQHTTLHRCLLVFVRWLSTQQLFSSLMSSSRLPHGWCLCGTFSFKLRRHRAAH